MLNNLDSVLLKKDYRGRRILVGAQGVLKDEELNANITMSGFKFVEKNGIYVWCFNLDARNNTILN